MSEPVEDEIDRLASALRADATGRSKSAARTRAEVVRRSRAASRSSRGAQLAAAAALIVVVLGGPTAWAWWTGRVSSSVQPSAVETPTSPASPLGDERPTAPAVTVRDEEVVSVPAVEPETRSVETPRVEAPAPSRPAIDPRERETYGEAHALHFDDHDPRRALDAWDRYLATYPRGRFALEARYNRALCLVRIGRSDEARAALAPFADGEPGAYRQREASHLLEAMTVAP